jgi:hypothetical protein
MIYLARGYLGRTEGDCPNAFTRGQHSKDFTITFDQKVSVAQAKPIARRKMGEPHLLPVHERAISRLTVILCP